MTAMMSLLIILNSFIIIASAFLMPLWAPFMAHIGGDVRTAGVAICIFSIIMGISTMLVAKLTQTFKLEIPFLWISALIVAISYGGYLLVSSPIELYLVQLILGLGCALQTPPLYAIYQRQMNPQESTFGWGVWNGTYNISIGVAALTSSNIMHLLGIHEVLWVLFGISLLSMGLSSFIAWKLSQ